MPKNINSEATGTDKLNTGSCKPLPHGQWHIVVEHWTSIHITVQIHGIWILATVEIFLKWNNKWNLNLVNFQLAKSPVGYLSILRALS